MTTRSSMTTIRQPGVIQDPLTDLACEGERRMLAAAIEAACGRRAHRARA